MDWAAEGKGNRNPEVLVNGRAGTEIITLQSGPGKSLKLDASASFDPDGDELSFKWWFLQEAGSYTGELHIPEQNADRIRIQVPEDAGGTSIHIICEVEDGGNPALSAYRRIIIETAAQ